MSNKKYALTSETKTAANGAMLYRIKALRTFGCIEKGWLGGFVEKESNLSHDGEAWVFDDAMVFGNAHVCCDSQVRDDAEVFGYAQICDRAGVFENAKVFGEAVLFEDVVVCDFAQISGQVVICGAMKVGDDSCITSPVRDKLTEEILGEKC